MLVDIVYIIIGSILQVIAFALSGVSWLIPDAVQEAIATGFSQLNYLQGILPIYADPITQEGMNATVGLLDIFSWVISILVALFFFRLVLWIMKLIPFLNIRSDMGK